MLKSKAFTWISLILGSISSTALIPYINKLVDNWVPEEKEKEKENIVPESDEKLIREQYIKDIYKRIDKWTKDNGGCNLLFTISHSKRDYLKLNLEEMLSRPDADIFTRLEYLDNRSKFEQFADDLENRNESLRSYNDSLRRTCSKYKSSNRPLNMHWRNKLNNNLSNKWIEEWEINSLTPGVS